MTRIAMPRPLCPCGRKFKARGLCATHHRAALRGNPVWVAQQNDINAPGARYVYVCDEPGCTVIGMPGLVPASHHSRIVGVRPHGQGVHYCPQHHPLDRCRVCRRQMRPEHTPEGLWPETVSRGWSGKCHSCSLGMLEEIVEHHPLPEQEVKVIRRMIDDRFADPDDRLLLVSSLIGDDID